MTSPFHGPKLKIKRANQHIAELQSVFTSFIANTPHSISIHKNGDGLVAEIVTEHELPWEIPTIIGDAVHNLRAALDHLACILVELNGGTPTRNTYFPFEGAKNEFESAVERKIKGASAEAIDLVKFMQVHGEPGGNNSLWSLNILDRADKHRSLIPSVSVSTFRNIRTFNADGSLGAQIGEIIISNCKGGIPLSFTGAEKFECDPNSTIDIFFDNVEVFKGDPVIPTLKNLSQVVLEIIEVCNRRLIKP